MAEQADDEVILEAPAVWEWTLQAFETRQLLREFNDSADGEVPNG